MRARHALAGGRRRLRGAVVGSLTALGRRRLAERSLERLSSRHAVRQLSRRACSSATALFWFERSLQRNCCALLITGLLGGFTTFSAFSVESLIMIQRGELVRRSRHAGPRRRLARLQRGFRLSEVGQLIFVEGRGRCVVPAAPNGLKKHRAGASLPSIRRNLDMRTDKFTTTFQEALADAQSLAVTRDNPYIEPVHVLAAMLAQADGPKALARRAGVNVPAAAGRARRRDRSGCRRCRAAKGAARAADVRAAAGGREGSPQARRPVHLERMVVLARRLIRRHRLAPC